MIGKARKRRAGLLETLFETERLNGNKKQVGKEQREEPGSTQALKTGRTTMKQSMGFLSKGHAKALQSPGETLKLM